MGFIAPDLPDVDLETWRTLPRATRLQIVTRHWAEHGFGTPSAVNLLYVIKIAAYVAAAAAIIALTPGLGGLDRIGDWWTQPIVYQKVIIFTLLPGTRQIFEVAVESVQTSCGWAVPVMELVKERETLVKYHAQQDPVVWTERYQARTHSIDGLPVRTTDRYIAGDEDTVSSA